MDQSAGRLRYRDQGGQWRDAPAVNIHYEVEVAGLLARLKITQHFFNPSTETIEAVYTYLPTESTVDTLEVVTGERHIVGEISEKTSARREYEEAKSTGKRAALVEQARKNIFSTAVSAILPGESVAVTIWLQAQVDYQRAFSPWLPTTLTLVQTEHHGRRRVSGHRVPAGRRRSVRRSTHQPAAGSRGPRTDNVWPCA